MTVTRAVETFEISLKAFIRRDDRVLMMREADTGFWELPGGRIDQGEAWDRFEAILARELREEVGFDLRVQMTDALVPLMRQRPTDGQHILQLVRICHWQAGDVALSDEHQAFAWFSQAETLDLGYPERSNFRDGLRDVWALSAL